MARAVIENWDQFAAFLASRPLCQWCDKKQQQTAEGLLDENGKPLKKPKKDDNADLAAALASMA